MAKELTVQQRLMAANSANFYYTELLALRNWLKRWRYVCNTTQEMERFKAGKKQLKDTLEKGEFKNITAALKFRREHKELNKQIGFKHK